jgi:ribose transport system substrate-binding protein
MEGRRPVNIHPKQRRRIVVLIGCAGAAAALAVTAAATTNRVQSSSAAPCPPKGTKIGYSPLTMSFQWFGYVVKGIKAEAKRCGVTVLVSDPAGDAAKQANQVENMVTAGAKAIAISANDAKSISNVVKRAKAAGVKVVQHDSTVPGAQARVGVPERDFGSAIGKVGAQWLKRAKPNQSSYKVAILNADSLGPVLLTRKAGLLAGMKSGLASKPFKVVADQEAYAEDTALDTAATILTKNPDLDLILCVNDVGALGATSAIKAAGLKPAKDVAAVGSATERVLKAIIDGSIPGGILVPGISAGQRIATASFQLLAGKKPGFYIPEQLVSVTTVAQAKKWQKTKGN